MPTRFRRPVTKGRIHDRDVLEECRCPNCEAKSKNIRCKNCGHVRQCEGCRLVDATTTMIFAGKDILSGKETSRVVMFLCPACVADGKKAQPNLQRKYGSIE